MFRTTPTGRPANHKSFPVFLLIALLAVTFPPSPAAIVEAQDECAPLEESAKKPPLKADACPQSEAPLLRGETRQRELATGQSRCFKVEVKKRGQYVQILLRQNGIDVETTLYDPDGKFLVRRDTTTGTKGVEPVSFVADKPGVYTAVVEAPGTPDQAPPETKGKPNSFDITFARLRPASARDKLSVRGEWEFHSADVLRTSGREDQLACAVVKFRRALDTYGLLNDLEAETQARNYLGYSLNKLRRYREALAYLLPAVGVWPSLKNPFREGEALNNLSFAYEMIGDIDSAQEAGQRALSLFSEARAKAKDEQELNDINLGEINTLINLSDLHIQLHQPDKAISSLKSHIRRPFVSQNPHLAAILLRDIGRAYESKGEHREALEQFKSALAQLPKDVPQFAQLRATILNSMGVMQIYLNEYTAGLSSFNEALELYGDNEFGRAAVYNSLGGTHASKDEEGKRAALGYYWKTLDILDGFDELRRTFQVTVATSDTLYNLAVAQRDLSQLDEAKASIEEAIAYIEFLRTRSGQQENRESFFAGKRFYYEFHIGLLMRLHEQRPAAGHDTEALRASERARGRSLLDLLIKAEVAAPAGVPAELVRRVTEAQTRLTNAMRRRRRAARSDETKSALAAAMNEVNDREKDYRALGQELKRTNAASLLQPYALDFEQIKALLDPETVLLVYEVGGKKSFLWVVTRDQKDSPVTAELPGRESLEKLVRDYRDALTARGCHIKNEFEDERRKRIAEADKAYPGAAASLGETLLGPAAPFIGSKRVAIVASEALQFVPFGALPEPTVTPSARGMADRGVDKLAPPLIVGHEVVYLPSVTALSEIRNVTSQRPPAPKVIAALANPVVDPSDKRINRRESVGAVRKATPPRTDAAQQVLRGPKCVTSDEFTSLPGTREEVRKISDLVPDENKKLIVEGFTANLATLKSNEFQDYRIIHFATHAYVPPGSPEGASIVLSLFNERGEPVPGHLRLSDIYRLRINADLVTLSACETGIGRDVIGEGLVGLSRGFMYAGAPRVVASLWKVDDDATSALMSDFYAAMLTQGQTPSAALREAQKNMFEKPLRAEWKFPFYWAAFMLQGEWQGGLAPRAVSFREE